MVLETLHAKHRFVAPSVVYAAVDEVVYLYRLSLPHYGFQPPDDTTPERDAAKDARRELQAELRTPEEQASEREKCDALRLNAGQQKISSPCVKFWKAVLQRMRLSCRHWSDLVVPKSGHYVRGQGGIVLFVAMSGLAALPLKAGAPLTQDSFACGVA